MTPREAILARLGRSPATMPELYDALVRYAGVQSTDAYKTGFAVVSRLIHDGAVEHFQPCNVYRLTGRLCPDGSTDTEDAP